MLDKRFFRQPLILSGVFFILLLSATGYLQAADKQQPEIINQKLSSLELKIQTLEENQVQILKNQETILETLQQLKVWIRRS